MVTDASSEKKKNMIKIAAVQMETLPSRDGAFGSDTARDFFDRAVSAVKRAVEEHGANLVLLQELFMGPYFCQSQEADLFALAESDIEGNNGFILSMQNIAKSLNVVLPISLFEQKNNTFYNSVVMIDADGEILGTYRKYNLADAIYKHNSQPFHISNSKFVESTRTLWVLLIRIRYRQNSYSRWNWISRKILLFSR